MKQLEADVVVIAAGTAGLAAAVTAVEGGASVIVFEKSSTVGGAGNMAMGPFAVESRLQRIRKISLTKEEAFKFHMNYTHWRVDARLVRAYIYKSASTIDWLEKLGVEFIDVQSHNPGFEFTFHIIKGPDYPREQPGAASAMIKILFDRAKELGVEFFLRTPAKKILKEGSRVTGVIAEDESGEDIQTKAKAVIIATGGFGDNTEWIKKYTGYEWGRDIFSRRIPGLVGDGIRMAWEVGAASTDMIMQPGCRIPDLQEFFTLGFTFHQPNLMVNILGERFMDEEITQTTSFGGNAVSRQKDRCAFMIFDEATKRYYEQVGLDFPPGILIAVPLITIDNFDAELEQALGKGNKYLFVADSMEELAGKTGIDLENLRKTLDEYNQACESGRDEQFNKKAKYLRPVKEPKFYCGQFFLSGNGAMGGIKINHKAEVMTKDFGVIPGLYAAGTDANSIYGDTYIFNLPGNTLGFALNTGRMAAETALEYIKSAAK